MRVLPPTSRICISITERQKMGGWLTFDTTGEQTVHLKIAVSFDSVETACQYLENEISDWGFDSVETAAKAEWDEALATVGTPQISQIEGRKLYTAFYRSLIQPRNRKGDPFGWPNDAEFWDDQYTL